MKNAFLVILCWLLVACGPAMVLLPDEDTDQMSARHKTQTKQKRAGNQTPSVPETIPQQEARAEKKSSRLQEAKATMRGIASSPVAVSTEEYVKPPKEKVGLYPIKIGNKEGYIDKTGRVVIKPKFDIAFSFHEGLAMVRVDEKYGFVDKTGRFIVKPQYDAAYSFSEGLAAVQVGEEFGFIDKTGRLVVKPQYNHPIFFSEGLAVVQVDGKFSGFIDKTGRMVIKPQYDDASSSFSEGLAAVKVGEKYGFVDKTGRLVY